MKSPTFLMLVLAYGPLQWQFPGWLWGTALFLDLLDSIDEAKKDKK